MTELPIVQWPSQVLETPAKRVVVFDSELRSFVDNMFETMAGSRGVGLAANQVNDLRRVLVIYIPSTSEVKEEWHNKKYVFINPEIIFKEGKFIFREGCLSFPELFESVERAQKIRVKAQDLDGVEFEVDANDLFAVCLQHEIDHLDGIVFTDRMSRLKASIIKKKMLKKNGRS